MRLTGAARRRLAGAFALGLALAAAAGRPAPAQEPCPPALAAALKPDVVTCRLMAEGRLASQRGNGAVAWRLYNWQAPADPAPTPVYGQAPYAQTAVTLTLAERPETPFWVRWTWQGVAWFEAPYLAPHPQYGEFLVVPGRYSGTGAGIEDHVFLPDHGRGWTEIRAAAFEPETGTGWLKDLLATLPPGHQVWKGIAIDYASLTGTTAVWREGDANCCPSGGEVWFRLRVAGPELHLALVQARYTPPGKPSP